MVKIDSRFLIDLIEQSDVEAEEARSYSGRGMYGRECVGLVVSNVFSAVAALYSGLSRVVADEIDLEDYLEALSDVIRETRQDGMGLDHIIYWPALAWPVDEGPDLDPDDTDDPDVRIENRRHWDEE